MTGILLIPQLRNTETVYLVSHTDYRGMVKKLPNLDVLRLNYDKMMIESSHNFRLLYLIKFVDNAGVEGVIARLLFKGP